MPESVLVSIREALGEATDTLAGAGCDTPRLDAELLLAEALGVGRDWLVREAHASLPAARWERFHELIARRAAREPVAYILGRKEFRWIAVAVDRRVLIPRPETELLVEVGLTLPEGATVVDVGTGSGAVALALKQERPDLRVSAVDSSGPALTLARENAHHLALDVHFAQSDLTAEDGERFYAILANLPYVPDGTALPPEVAEYEPAGALFGGADGLHVIRRLLGMLGGAGAPAGGAGAGRSPREVAGRAGAGQGARGVTRGADAGRGARGVTRGADAGRGVRGVTRGADAGRGVRGVTRGADAGPRVVALEVGAGQAETVARLVRDAGFDRVERLRDLAGHERVVVGRR